MQTIMASLLVMLGVAMLAVQKLAIERRQYQMESGRTPAAIPIRGIAATIAAARGSFPGRRLVLVFQPHRYTRTRDLFEDFVRVLSTADALVLTDVYPAGEPPIVAADGRALARAVRVAGKVEPVFAEAIADLPSAIRTLVRDGDVVVTMGAGSIGQVPAMLRENA